MTNKQINAAIATGLGWEKLYAYGSSTTWCWVDGDWENVASPSFDPLHNANHLRLAWLKLSDEQWGVFTQELCRRTNPPATGPLGMFTLLRDVLELPLRTCCEALLEAVK